ncbi:hypothetical protein C2S53_019451 [Perilla frutescens var. hirtella]|uniref:Uncharacterized protein n=1 Tax=Perilla frutescens var. hirtella TaxID=608512 RepID=A0AAD4IYW0_PERFH|nr:hypothetical protein C2S53_019451 [Perilla frutescens var. hirtella]
METVLAEGIGAVGGDVGSDVAGDDEGKDEEHEHTDEIETEEALFLLVGADKVGESDKEECEVEKDQGPPKPPDALVKFRGSKKHQDLRSPLVVKDKSFILSEEQVDRCNNGEESENESISSSVLDGGYIEEDGKSDICSGRRLSDVKIEELGGRSCSSSEIHSTLYNSSGRHHRRAIVRPCFNLSMVLVVEIRPETVNLPVN